VFTFDVFDTHEHGPSGAAACPHYPCLRAVFTVSKMSTVNTGLTVNTGPEHG